MSVLSLSISNDFCRMNLGRLASTDFDAFFVATADKKFSDLDDTSCSFPDFWPLSDVENIINVVASFLVASVFSADVVSEPSSS